MNIREYLNQSHPDLGLAMRTDVVDLYFRRLWQGRYQAYSGPDPAPLSASVLEWSTNAAARNHRLDGSVGLVICSWNRPQYLERCLRSVADSDLCGSVTVIVDDASGDAETLRLIREFDLDTPLIRVFKTSRGQIHHSLDLGWSLLSGLGCRYLTNLDSDTLVAPRWLTVIRDLFTREAGAHAKTVVSGFNRHRNRDIIDELADCRVRRRMGGINYFFSTALFPEIRKFLFTTAWDSLLQAHFEMGFGTGYRMVSTKPSQVQHIGRIGMNSGPLQEFDRAEDFAGTLE